MEKNSSGSVAAMMRALLQRVTAQSTQQAPANSLIQGGSAPYPRKNYKAKQRQIHYQNSGRKK